MSMDLLLQEFERIADAPNATARLRAFVLDLAVRGKLTSMCIRPGMQRTEMEITTIRLQFLLTGRGRVSMTSRQSTRTVPQVEAIRQVNRLSFSDLQTSRMDVSHLIARVICCSSRA